MAIHPWGYTCFCVCLLQLHTKQIPSSASGQTAPSFGSSGNVVGSILPWTLFSNFVDEFSQDTLSLCPSSHPPLWNCWFSMCWPSCCSSKTSPLNSSHPTCGKFFFFLPGTRSHCHSVLWIPSPVQQSSGEPIRTLMLLSAEWPPITHSYGSKWHTCLTKVSSGVLPEQIHMLTTFIFAEMNYNNLFYPT